MKGYCITFVSPCDTICLVEGRNCHDCRKDCIIAFHSKAYRITWSRVLIGTSMKLFRSIRFQNLMIHHVPMLPEYCIYRLDSLRSFLLPYSKHNDWAENCHLPNTIVSVTLSFEISWSGCEIWRSCCFLSECIDVQTGSLRTPCMLRRRWQEFGRPHKR